ncbi:MAG: nucleotidyltransferase domain-containing protein [Thermoplasmatota archaeon]
MNEPFPTPSTSREDIVAILLAAAVGVGIGVVATRALGKPRPASSGRQPPLDVGHAVVVPKPLKDIAAEAGLQPPTALVHLRKLEDEGKVQKVSTPEGPRYAIQPFLRCEWIYPEHGLRDVWQSSVGVDWRFPLVSRVRDAAAQAFLLEWLDRAQARGLLPAHVSRFEPPAKRPPEFSIVVYGSCARGDAGANSDLDILLAGGFGKGQMEALKELAHEVGLKGGRRPDVRIVGADLKGAGPALVDALRREGKTIFANLPDAHFIERVIPSAHV